MDLLNYYKSIGEEICSTKDRIRFLMNNTHFLTDGELKESILRQVIRRYLPEHIKIARGFIHNGEACSSQVDVLIYDSKYPVLFKEGDLVFVTPDSVRAVIEVKARQNITDLRYTLSKLNQIAELVSDINCFFGLFSYDYERKYNRDLIKRVSEITNVGGKSYINHLVLGKDYFMKYWANDPITNEECSKWHIYKLEDLSYAYFINNLLDYVSDGAVSINNRAWFPLDSKERLKLDEINLEDDIG
ncbi:MAG: hypothetical protein JG777_2416 [Clostridia bacterium]|nr:hypothetical protein [Clostridia bacterium]